MNNDVAGYFETDTLRCLDCGPLPQSNWLDNAELTAADLFETLDRCDKCGNAWYSLSPTTGVWASPDEGVVTRVFYRAEDCGLGDYIDPGTDENGDRIDDGPALAAFSIELARLLRSDYPHAEVTVNVGSDKSGVTEVTWVDVNGTVETLTENDLVGGDSAAPIFDLISGRVDDAIRTVENSLWVESWVVNETDTGVDCGQPTTYADAIASAEDLRHRCGLRVEVQRVEVSK